jgi:hypothetical protein
MFREISAIERGYKCTVCVGKYVEYSSQVGVRGSVVVKALCYKPEGRGFDTR